MTDFARAQLLKYGWSEGKGLGKHENGIVKPLRPQVKLDTQGVGHDTTEFKWWEFVYNKASNNLYIDVKSNEIKMKVKNRSAVEIHSTKSAMIMSELKKSGKLQYGGFVKTSTLEDGRVTHDPNYHESMLSKCTALPLLPNDEDLFKACGGRTAHKGARHGLKCNGKLARIERQEQELLKKMTTTDTTNDWVKVEKKKKKKKKYNSEKIEMEEPVEDSPALSNPVVIPEAVGINPTEETEVTNGTKSKKTKRKVKHRMEDLTHQLATTLDISDSAPTIEKEKKKKNSKRKREDIETVDDTSVEMSGKKKKSKQIRKLKIVEDIRVGDKETLQQLLKICRECRTEPQKLNNRIAKRKKIKLVRKERERIDQLSKNLMGTLDIQNEDNSKNDDLPAKKKMKLERKKKKKIDQSTGNSMETVNSQSEDHSQIDDSLVKKKKKKKSKQP